MKPTTTDDVLALLDASYTSAAVGVAMECGLFWRLEKRPMDVTAIAESLDIPINRCRYWLQLLADAGLLDLKGEVYTPSTTARRAVLDAMSEQTWAFLAGESRARLPVLRDLALHIKDRGSVWMALGIEPSDYFQALNESPERARRFTHMLYELHTHLADELAERLDMNGVNRFLDLGGGSGVVTMALLRRHPHLSAVIADIPNVCAAGKEIVAEQGLTDRVEFHPLNFMRDDLPGGFELVVECDVNVYGVELLSKVRDALNDGGRLVIVDQLAPADGVAPASRVHWAFVGALRDPEFRFQSVGRITGQLKEAGFEAITERELPPIPGVGTTFTRGLMLIEARR